MILILLPMYNEEKSLPKLLPKIKSVANQLNEEFIIVACDDGSSDNTLRLLNEFKEKMPIVILDHKINRGLGETSRDLFEYASAIAGINDVIIRMDCDDTHEPEYIPQIVEKVRLGCDVVIASRFAKGGGQKGVSNYRAFISRAANLFMKVFFNIPGLYEYSCGFRGYSSLIIKRAIKVYGNNFIQLKGLGFTCTLEKLIKLNLLSATFGEIPFILRYDQKRSESKMVSSITTLGYITMTVLYHWPWGGWKSSARNLSNDKY